MTIDFNDPLPPGRRAPQRPAPGAAAPFAQPAAGLPRVPALLPAAVAATDPPPPSARLPNPLLWAALQAINHLLQQQAWARERLRGFGGRVVRIAIEPSSPLALFAPPLSAAITADGLLNALPNPSGDAGGPGPASQAGATAAADAATATPPADVSLWLRPSPSMLFDGLSGGARGLSAHLRIDGDVMLAAALGDLAEHLRWDAEEDASRLIGDIAARRLFSGLAGLREQWRRTRGRVEQSTVQFLTVEDPQLLSSAALSGLAQALQDLERRLDQVAVRTSALER